MEQEDELVRETRALRYTIIWIALIAALAAFVVLWAAPTVQHRRDYARCLKQLQPYESVANCDRPR